MLAMHDARRTTAVNLFNSHGNLEQDFWIDARLYDCGGHLVGERERWLLARRNQLVRGEITELLPNGVSEFIGHIALNFSPDAHAFYPYHLQALVEYRAARGCAHVMAWSDTWNARERLAELAATLDSPLAARWIDEASLPHPGLLYRNRFRVWCEDARLSTLSFTNPGTEPGYAHNADYTLLLEDGRGRSLRHQATLGPNATDFGSVEQFFPDARAFLDGQPWALAIVESTSDIASMHVTDHRPSGAISAEHFMDCGAWYQGRHLPASGA